MLHPIVEHMPPSPEQMPAITARGCDVVVTAGAGTGKTRTLVARYLSLLADGLPLRSVVAITFTRKAAREMRNRVRSALLRYLDSPNLTEADLSRWRALYRELDAARIGTIHSLCSEILRAHPAEAGVDPRFQTLEDAQSAQLHSDALDQALAWAADDAQAARLFALLGERELRAGLNSMLKRRLDVAAVLQCLPEDVAECWLKQAEVDQGLSTLDGQMAAAYPALRALFKRTCDAYAALKQESNSLDYDDLEQGALALLRDNAAVRSYWQGLVQAILVDEFQDTNGRQRDLVALLNGRQRRGRLFVVGDAKQSIYRFRGADVEVFRQERRRVQEAGGKVCALEVSYRAHRELLQALNDLLRPVLGEREDPERPWVEPFAELLCDPGHSETELTAPYVELLLAVGSKSGGALERAASALAERIVQLVEVERPCVVVEGVRRHINYGDVAILCRSSGSFGAYEDALEQVGAPSVTVAGGGFYDRPEIRDLLNALQAMADPTDDLTLVGLLRSPSIALSDVDVFRLSQGQDPYKRTPSLWDLLQRSTGLARLSTPGRERAERAREIVRNLHSLAGRTTVADLLKAFLDATAYRAALIQAGQQREARNVSKLLADAHASGIVGVGAFLEYVRGLRGSGAREGEARTPAEGAVLIMSVHQAKGLEFPVVVIGDATHQSRGSSGVLLDHELGVLFPLKAANSSSTMGEDDDKSALYELAKSRDEDRERAESDRLLYVAATRAQEKLIISGCIKLTATGALSKPAGWLGRLAAPECLDLKRALAGCRELGQKPVSIPLSVGQSTVSCCVDAVFRVAMVTREAARAQTAVTLPPPLLGPVPARAAVVDETLREREREPAPRVWRVVPARKGERAPAWVVGKLVHAALAGWRFADEGFDNWLRARARSYGVTDDDQLQDATKHSRELLRRFVRHPLFQEMERAERRLHEVPYSMQVCGRAESGLIDALFEQSGRWTVVEFKSDQIRKDEVRERLLTADYHVQVQRYVNAVESFLKQRPRVLLCLLNCEDRLFLYEWSLLGEQARDYAIREVER